MLRRFIQFLKDLLSCDYERNPPLEEEEDYAPIWRRRSEMERELEAEGRDSKCLPPTCDVEVEPGEAVNYTDYDSDEPGNYRQRPF